VLYFYLTQGGECRPRLSHVPNDLGSRLRLTAMASAEQPAGSVANAVPSETDPMSNSLNLSESNKMDDLSELGEEEEFYGRFASR